MKTILTIVNIMIATALFAGSGPATIDCSSKSKRTIVNIVTQDISMVSSAKIKIDDDSLNLSNPVEEWIIYSQTDSVLTINARFDNPTPNAMSDYFEFWAIPSSFNYLVNERHSTKLKFNAKIRFSDPRIGKGPSSPIIKLECILNYSI